MRSGDIPARWPTSLRSTYYLPRLMSLELVATIELLAGQLEINDGWRGNWPNQDFFASRRPHLRWGGNS